MSQVQVELVGTALGTALGTVLGTWLLKYGDGQIIRESIVKRAFPQADDFRMRADLYRHSTCLDSSRGSLVSSYAR